MATAPAAAPSPKASAPFTKVNKAVIGLDVLVCHAQKDGLTDPRPGRITGVYAGKDTTADVMIFNPRSHIMSPCQAVDNVSVAFSPDELEKQASLGRKWIAYPYDPTDPKPYVQPEAKKAPIRRPGGES